MMFLTPFLRLEPVRALLDAARADTVSIGFVRAARMPHFEQRTWGVSRGGVDGGSGDIKFSFARDGARLIGMNYTPQRPWKSGSLGESELSGVADRIIGVVFPKVGGWKLTLSKKIESDSWDPSTIAYDFAGNDTSPRGVRKFLIQLERATGYPILMLVVYRDEQKASTAAFDNHYLFTFAFGRGDIAREHP